MGELNPNYPVMELAISFVSYEELEDGHERLQQGDIVAVRKPGLGIGIRELQNFLWLRVEGLEENEFAVLTDTVVTSAGVEYDKRRYCIPLERITEVDPDFDISLANQDHTVKFPFNIYQPFLLVDYDEGYYFVLEDGHLPFQASGLIFDKETQEYL